MFSWFKEWFERPKISGCSRFINIKKCSECNEPLEDSCGMCLTNLRCPEVCPFCGAKYTATEVVGRWYWDDEDCYENRINPRFVEKP